MYIHMRTHTHIQTNTYIHVHVIYISVCRLNIHYHKNHTYKCVQIYRHMCMYVYTYIYIYIHIHIDAYIHTYIHGTYKSSGTCPTPGCRTPPSGGRRNHRDPPAGTGRSRCTWEQRWHEGINLLAFAAESGRWAQARKVLPEDHIVTNSIASARKLRFPVC